MSKQPLHIPKDVAKMLAQAKPVATGSQARQHNILNMIPVALGSFAPVEAKIDVDADGVATLSDECDREVTARALAAVVLAERLVDIFDARFRT